MSLFKKKKTDVANEETVQDKVSHLKGDRNDISVGGKSGLGNKKIALALIFLVFVIVVSSLFLFFFISKEDENVIQGVELSEKEQYNRIEGGSLGLDKIKEAQARLEKLSLEKMKREAEAEAEAEEENEISTHVAASVPPMPQPMPPMPPMPPEPRKNARGEIILSPSERQLLGSTLISADSISVPQVAANGNYDGQGFGEGGDDGDFLKGASFKNGSVSRIRNRSFMLSAGTAAPCVLKTKIITNYPAFVMCQLTKNIYSDDGKNILVRAGAEFHGEQTKVMSQGIARVFVNWSTLKDRNVNIRVDALGADGLGAAGLPAWIDTHFWDRFGGAIMLSFIEDAIAAAASQATKSNSNGGVTFDNSQNAASDMARIALENSINIPPTAVVNQGEMLTVIVPRYIDFSSVYQNQ